MYGLIWMDALHMTQGRPIEPFTTLAPLRPTHANDTHGTHRSSVASAPTATPPLRNALPRTSGTLSPPIDVLTLVTDESRPNSGAGESARNTISAPAPGVVDASTAEAAAAVIVAFVVSPAASRCVAWIRSIKALESVALRSTCPSSSPGPRASRRPRLAVCWLWYALMA